ncbi:MAG: nicotinate (nicotinamide) nucleotide adenylyltransferase [Clostridia bacterium]|nr:nicotinate (nicotinamide) nucleotide adenylyltransferase [Clostridia bacterium]
MANIAVFGGTFDPFHIGHHEILRALCKSGLFKRVLVVPTKIPPHKPAPNEATDQDRIEMCRLSCSEFVNAETCLIEFEREGKSYTVDTIRELKKRYPRQSFYVVIGADMLRILDQWHEFNKLKRMVTFIVFNRNAYTRFYSDAERMVARGAKLLLFDEEIVRISSTELRKDLDPLYLTKKVEDYVNQRKLYRKKDRK